MIALSFIIRDIIVRRFHTYVQKCTETNFQNSVLMSQETSRHVNQVKIQYKDISSNTILSLPTGTQMMKVKIIIIIFGLFTI